MMGLGRGDVALTYSTFDGIESRSVAAVTKVFVAEASPHVSVVSSQSSNTT